MARSRPPLGRQPGGIQRQADVQGDLHVAEFHRRIDLVNRDVRRAERSPHVVGVGTEPTSRLPSFLQECARGGAVLGAGRGHSSGKEQRAVDRQHRPVRHAKLASEHRGGAFDQLHRGPEPAGGQQGMSDGTEQRAQDDLAVGSRNFSRSFDRCIVKAQVPRITVHGTRKTCGSLLAALDVHPRVAMQILRHSKIAVTMEIYTEVPSAATRDALKKLGQWLGS